MTDTVVTPTPTAARRLTPIALMLVGLIGLLAGLFSGLNGVRVSEKFSMTDLRHIKEGMYLYRIDLKAWPEPPFKVIDDSRHGSSGTLTELSMDGAIVEAGRASRPVLLSRTEAAYLHTGVGNLYVSPGPTGTAKSTFEATYIVRLHPAIWISITVFGGLILLAGLGLLVRMGALFDLVLIIMISASAAALWLNLLGWQDMQQLNVAEARKLEPHGYVVRLPRLGPMGIPATDRNLPVISGRLLDHGMQIGTPLALSPEIIKKGDGAHLMANRGAFYFSLPGNISAEEAVGRFAVQVTYALPRSILLMAAASLAITLFGGLVAGSSPLMAIALRPRYATSAIALPLAIVAIAGGYLGWLIWVDALHMHGPPGERDWFADNEGWRMAGLVRTYPYEGIIVGTSVSQNFYMAEASDRLGQPVLNATMAGSTPKEQAALARLALKRDSTGLVIWEIHMTSFTQPTDAQRPQFFPAHLFDRSPHNDVEYYFSLQAWLDARNALYARDGGKQKPLDPINKWGERMDFGPAVVARTYCERKDQPHSPVSIAALTDNLRTHVLPVIQSNPERTFVLFIPAYSILMHMPEGGRLSGLEGAARTILDVLGALPNVSLYDFQGIGPEIGDAALYRDDMHYHSSINSRILTQIGNGSGQITEARIAAHETALTDTFIAAEKRFRAVMDPLCEDRKE